MRKVQVFRGEQHAAACPSHTCHTCKRRTRASFTCPAASSRREVLQAGIAIAGTQFLFQAPVDAAGKGSALRRKIPADQYSDLEEGLKFYDLVQGTGVEIEKGTTCTVHYDVLYRGIDVVSSRQARLLGGNRTIAEPFVFVAGSPVRAVSVNADADRANGLFSGSGGPKPPPALSDAVVGMKVGGIRSVLVSKPELGYVKRMQEIPPGDPFELRVEILQITK